MKHSDLKMCVFCNKGMMHNKMFMQFYRMKLNSMMIDPGAVQRAAGFEMMMGPLAAVMGADEDLAIETHSVEVLVCMECAMESKCIASIPERVDD